MTNILRVAGLLLASLVLLSCTTTAPTTEAGKVVTATISAQSAAEASIVIEEVAERPIGGEPLRSFGTQSLLIGAWRVTTLESIWHVRYENKRSGDERIDLRSSLVNNGGTLQLQVERSWGDLEGQIIGAKDMKTPSIVRVSFDADGTRHYVYFVVDENGKVDVYVQDAY